MTSEEKIGHREALTFLIILMTAKVFLSFPRDMAYVADSAGWLIVLLSGLLSIIGFYFLYALLKKFPGQNLIQISQNLLGPLIGTILGFIFFLFFLVITALFLRQFSESFIISILPTTPISIISSAFLIILIQSCQLGIESLTRVAWFLGLFLLLLFIFLISFSTQHADLQQLAPILGPGLPTILKRVLPNSEIFAEIIMLGIIAPLIRDKQRIFKVGFYSLIWAIVINIGITILVVLVYNYESAGKLIFPSFQLSRLISFEKFLQRSEAFFVFLWFFVACIQLSGLFYGAVTSFAQTFKLKNYRPTTWALGILVFTISLIPENMSQAVEINSFQINKYYSIIAFGFPFLLWLATLILGKKSGGTK